MHSLLWLQWFSVGSVWSHADLFYSKWMAFKRSKEAHIPEPASLYKLNFDTRIHKLRRATSNTGPSQLWHSRKNYLPKLLDLYTLINSSLSRCRCQNWGKGPHYESSYNHSRPCTDFAQSMWTRRHRLYHYCHRRLVHHYLIRGFMAYIHTKDHLEGLPRLALQERKPITIAWCRLKYRFLTDL